MTCRELTDFLMDYLGGTMPDTQRAAFERHLAVCPTCVAYLDSYRRTVALAAGTGEKRDLRPIPEALIRAIVSAAGES